MSPENNKESLSCRETELTLSLPGSNRGSVEPKLGSSEDRSGSFKVWLPVKTNSEKTIIAANRDRSKWKYVKVSFDGNPILGKINLEAHGSYRHLTAALEELVVAQSRRRRRSSFTLTYQDKDGDWMLVGDVLWRMFVDSCKRLRLMDSSSFISSPNY